MKKLFLSLALVASFSLLSCSKSAQDYADEIQGLQKEYIQLINDGKIDEAAKISEKGEALAKEVVERCQEDPEFAQQFEEALGALQF